MSINLSLLCMVSILFMSSGCVNNQEKKEETYEHQELYDLNASTELIISLLQKDTLNSILVDADLESIDGLIKNFSPSEIALEVEVLNYEGTVALIFFKADGAWNTIRQQLIALAKEYPLIKFIQVDAQKLFKITEHTEIENFPAIIFLKHREEIARIEPINVETLQEDMRRYGD